MAFEARVATTRRCEALIRRTISTIRSGGFPRHKTTSGNPRLRSRCESIFAYPRSSYGRSRRAAITSPTDVFPDLRSRRIASTRRRSKGSPDLFPFLELEDRAEGAAPLDLLADPVLPLEHVEGAVRHLDGLLPSHDDEAGLVADDPVARADLLAARLDLAPDLPEAFRLARVGRDMAAEAREVQLEDRVEVPHRAVDHDAGHTLHEARVTRELPPDRGRPAADIDHDDVPRLRAVDRLDGLRPVPVGRLHGEGGSDELRAVPDPRDEPRDHAALLHRVREVRGRDLPERLGDVRVGVLLEQARGDRLAVLHRLLDRARRFGDLLGLDDRASDDDDRSARLDGLRNGLGVQAPRHGDGQRGRLRDRLQLLQRRLGDHLLVNRDVHVQVVHAERFELLRPHGFVDDPHQVDHDLRAVPPRGLHRLEDRRVVRDPHHRHDVRAGLHGDLDLERARVHRLQVRDDRLARERFLELADDLDPLRFDERGAGLQPVRAAFRRLRCSEQRPLQVHVVEGDLQDGLHGGAYLAVSIKTYRGPRYASTRNAAG